MARKRKGDKLEKKKSKKAKKNESSAEEDSEHDSQEQKNDQVPGAWESVDVDESAQEGIPSLLALNPETIGTKEEFGAAFQNIAEQLLNEHVLMINGKAHRLGEIEFYFYGDKHLDIFSHQDALQQACATWYFHRSSGKNYKAASYKGLDITFGEPGKGFGGILIRSLLDIDSDEYIEGSCNCVDHILSLNKIDGTIPEIKDFVEVEGFQLDVHKKGPLFLKPQSQLEKLPIFSSFRVGLTLKKTDGERHYYLMKPYRYLIYPLRVRKGRPNLVLSLQREGKSIPEIVKLTGCTKATVTKYVNSYNNSKGKEAKEYNGKNLTTEDLCALAQILAEK